MRTACDVKAENGSSDSIGIQGDGKGGNYKVNEKSKSPISLIDRPMRFLRVLAINKQNEKSLNKSVPV